MLFGGEPLLDPARCYKLLDQVKALGGASIVTNGVRLTPDVAQELTARKVRRVQITFDGAQEQHDQVRVRAADGGPTYETILENLVSFDTLPVLPGRSLRVNVTQTNAPGLGLLVKDLAAHLDPARWMLYFALVSDNDIGWDDVLPGGSASVSNMLVDLTCQAAEAGFIVPAPVSEETECGYCSKSFGKGGMVVNADGRLYSCWETAGYPEMAVGDVRGGYVLLEGNEHKWVQCGYKSQNQATRTGCGDNLAELNWTLRELLVRRELQQKQPASVR